MHVALLVKLGSVAVAAFLTVGCCFWANRWSRRFRPRPIPGRLRWKRQWFDCRVVWVDVALLDQSWREGHQRVVEPGGGIDGLYERFGCWLVETSLPIGMPLVNLNEATGNAISFTDGRHRFAWLRDHGVKSLPVITSPEEALTIRKQFGTKSRVSWLPSQGVADSRSKVSAYGFR
jgi:hypothetical protein